MTDTEELTEKACAIIYSTTDTKAIYPTEQSVVQDHFFLLFGFRCKLTLCADIIRACRDHPKKTDTMVYAIMLKYRNQRYGTNPANK